MNNYTIFRGLLRWRVSQAQKGNKVIFTPSGCIVEYPCGLKALLTFEDLAEEIFG